MSPARRRTAGSVRSLSRFATIHDALRRARPRGRQRKLHAPAKISDGSNASSTETNGATCEQGEGAQNMRHELGLEELPEDILHHLHSLMPIQDAARATCVSLGFLHSWRHYSNLILNDRTLGLVDKTFEEMEIHLIYKVDKILTNHYDNGVMVKTLKLNLGPCSGMKASCLDRWLRIIKSGVQEFSLVLPLVMNKIYSFPCSVLSNEAAASSIQSLSLFGCALDPTSTILGRLRRLKSLRLCHVQTTEDGLGHLLSKSCALERLVIDACSGIICLKIPCTMQQLKFLTVKLCKMMQVVEIDAPQLCSFHYGGKPVIYVRNSSQLKNVDISPVCLSGILSYARFSLPSIAQNVESLTLRGRSENANTPMLPSKLPRLKNLEIALLKPCLSPNYDAFSLVSFLDASPALESFILRVEQDAVMHDPVVGDDTEYRRQNLECPNNSLRKVLITGFCSAKSLVELTVHILERTNSLEIFTLDITYGYDRRTCNIAKFPTARMIGLRWPLSKRALEEAHRAVETADRYIKGRVPSSVRFEVLGPCSRCHIGK